MALAFLISAHTDAAHLKRLIQALPDESSIFVHIDRGVDIKPFTSIIIGDPRVTFLTKRIRVVWGSFRQVEYQMALLEAAMQSGKTFSHLISISGLDYPVWSKEEIRDYFTKNTSSIMLQAVDLTAQPIDSPTWRLYQSHRYLGTKAWRYGSLGSKLRVALREAAWHLHIRKPLTFSAQGKTYRLHKGSSWWAITPQLAEYVLDTWHNNKEYVNYFRDSFGCDETFIHTLAFNSELFAPHCIHTDGNFRDLEQVTPLTYIHYKPEIKILTEEDYDTIKHSGKMFCRKTISGISDTLMDHLDNLAPLETSSEAKERGLTILESLETSSEAKERGLTILVPLYNVERYIAQCANSLFSQTYPHIEYIFLNDCSPDNTIEELQYAIDRYPTRRDHIHILHHEKNKGIGAVRQHLVEEVRTDYFCFVDSDDILPPYAIERLMVKMQQTNADIIEGAYATICNGTTSSPIMPYHGSMERYRDRLMCQNIESNRLWGKLYSSHLLTKVPQLFEQGIDYSEDLYATLSLISVARVESIDDVVYLYRTDNTASYTKNVSESQRLSYLKANHRLLQYYRQRGHLPIALEIGILNSYRECLRSGTPLETIDNILQYYPEHLRARIIYHMLRSKTWHTLGDIAYRVARALCS